MFHQDNPQDGLVKFVKILQKNATLLREIQEEDNCPKKNYSLLKKIPCLFLKKSNSDDSDDDKTSFSLPLQKKISHFLQTIQVKTSDQSPAHVLKLILDHIEYFVKKGANLNDKIYFTKNNKITWKTITYVLLMQFSHFNFAEKIFQLGGNPNCINSDGTSLFDLPPRGRLIFIEVCWRSHLHLL